ncbi:hypothetical protein RJZ56_006391 [Blastomyces dermatitidis]|uniref:Extracellular membrane protein CFEM domain-containing protein n=2 Tax=Ajellomyces dermatitidis TaxID=5039 RepID=F2T689_AJEDA|nr:uncharacterized protein BDCG_05820 [Blastomyces dermatitidis ER-3]EEQ90700.1 hypothetical protein BDCG_05820 [Blastomyces dermatitidis ER-3]EGE78969.1 hypothetical protein BDDG_01906 [Blastomyces dermatitidis ATCC 18188]EQL29679.1 hypothetical protein BDFG_07732 [Blastomyces dermatitidis ATCC 26199]
MRKQRWVTYLVLAYRAPTVIAISLDQIQPIISFPPSCTRVYTSEISDCTVRDFANEGSCSPGCVEGLEALARSLNAACVGTRASPTSLIGLFFQGLGVQTLCPNAGGAGGGAGREIESSAPANPPDIPRVTETGRPPPTQAQTEEPSATTTTRRLAPSTTSTTSHSTSTTSDSYVIPSLPPSATASDPTSTTTSEPSATTTKTTDPNDDPFGGFGNAFDIIAPNQAASMSQPRKLAIGVAGAAVLFTMHLAW